MVKLYGDQHNFRVVCRNGIPSIWEKSFCLFSKSQPSGLGQPMQPAAHATRKLALPQIERDAK